MEHFTENSAAKSFSDCTWPTRCYACSFCKREFRSAQALGGHMNIHRRERARLNNCLSPHCEVLLRRFHHSQPICSSPSIKVFSSHMFLSPYDFVASERLEGFPQVASWLGSMEAAAPEEEKKPTGEDSTDLRLGFYESVQSDSSVGLKSYISHNDQTHGFLGDERLGSGKPHAAGSSAKTSAEEGIDLELRLGDSPKVRM